MAYATFENDDNNATITNHTAFAGVGAPHPNDNSHPNNNFVDSALLFSPIHTHDDECVRIY